MGKKIILSIFIILALFIVTGCEKEDDNKSNNKSTDVKTTDNSVVLYFSATGTTKKIAERIASKSGSELIEIIPKVAYTSDDLNYNSDCRANREQNDSNARPEIKNTIDISKYMPFSMFCYIALGWCIILSLPQLMSVLPMMAIAMLFCGGISYTAGAIMFGLGIKKRYMHSVFHIFVDIGAILHGLMVLLFVL